MISKCKTLPARQGPGSRVRGFPRDLWGARLISNPAPARCGAPPRVRQRMARSGSHGRVGPEHPDPRWGMTSRRVPWLVLAGLLAACQAPVPSYEIEVLQTLPHDTLAYTQGLVLDGDRLYESTGRYGSSELRAVDLASGAIESRAALSDDHFGEGLAKVGSSLVQLTWKEGVALVYDAATLEQTGTLSYEGEGWGLCYDGTWLYMSDGSSRLTRRDPGTFEVDGEIAVTRNGFSVQDLNELECVGRYVWANVYLTDQIVRIDKETGEVVGEIDAFGLTMASNRPTDTGAVLNGIAHDPATGTFYLTGKLWPTLFQVRVIE